MDLIDRYLTAVRRQLPRDNADDIVAELGDSLRSEAEDHERASGHLITEAELAALLKKRGHPWLLASRYQPKQYLIGPALFPFYLQALQIVVFWVVLPIVLFQGTFSAIFAADANASTWVREIISALFTKGWNAAIFAVGIVTIVFAILDHEKVRITLFDKWNPATLPEPSGERHVPRAETIFGLVFTLTFLTWWIGLVRIPEYFFEPHAGLRFAPAPIWATLYVPILLTAIAGAAVHVIDLVRPWRSVTVSVIDMTINAVNVAILAMILNAGEYVLVSGTGVTAEGFDRALWVNRSVAIGLGFIAVVIIFDICHELWRLRRARRTMVTV